MASPLVLSPSVPDNVAAARKQVQTSDFFALCYLMLNNLTYTDSDNGQKAVQQITNLLPTMPVPQGTVAGKWSLGWGPNVDDDNSNLMYAAEFSDSVSGVPVFSAVVIRGTDVFAKPSGIITQLVEDLDVLTQVVFPAGHPSGSKIAQGTSLGLDKLTRFADSSQRTIAQYLGDFVKANPGGPVVVTGHSLGGCQATVMALDLAGKLPEGAIIVPNTFAAPTAGNSAFIQLYERTFPFAPRWFNTLDLVPMGFANLDGIKHLWDPCGHPTPQGLKLVVAGFKDLLNVLGDGYSQQSAVNSRSLIGACRPPASPQPSQAMLDEVVQEIQETLSRAVKRAHVPLPVPDFLFKGILGWVIELLFQHLVPTGYWNAVAAWPGVAPIRNPFVQAAGSGGISR